MASGATEPRPTVLPSGAARAMASVPTLAAEPLRFSTMNCWPVISAILAHQMRDKMSVPPPGGKLPMKRTGPVGHGLPRRARADESLSVAAAAPRASAVLRRETAPPAGRDRLLSTMDVLPRVRARCTVARESDMREARRPVARLAET